MRPVPVRKGTRFGGGRERVGGVGSGSSDCQDAKGRGVRRGDTRACSQGVDAERREPGVLGFSGKHVVQGECGREIANKAYTTRNDGDESGTEARLKSGSTSGRSGTHSLYHCAAWLDNMKQGFLSLFVSVVRIGAKRRQRQGI